MRRHVRRIPLAALALLAAFACAPKRPAVEVPPAAPPTQHTDPAPPSAPLPPDPTPIYERLQLHEEEYASGIELLAAGDEVDGELRIAGAANEIRRALQECARTEGCELDRFLDSFERLLSDQSIALKRQAVRVRELETTIEIEEEPEREPGTTPFVTAIPEVGRTVSLLRGTDLRELITLNGPVRAAIDDWLTWMRPMWLDAYENYQFLRPTIAPIYEEAGLPEALLFAIMATETGGKVHAYSRAGAAGPLQFMRGTGQRYGLSDIDGFDMRLDPAAATRASVGFLNDLFEALHNSLEKALAAYNGGENRLERLHRRHDGASLWDNDFYYSLPRETREYVPRVLAAAWLFLHPEDYGLEPPRPEVEAASLTLSDEMSIAELAICLGQAGNRNGWFRTLRNLNPRLGPGDRVEAGSTIQVPSVVIPVYEERCLGGELVDRARELHQAAYPDEPELVPYVVRRGDTLSKIAARHRCVTLRELAVINGIRPPRYVIHVGQRLRIPTCG